jgi:two-component system nitrogen regulation sensor histidine kinase NtrY
MPGHPHSESQPESQSGTPDSGRARRRLTLPLLGGTLLLLLLVMSALNAFNLLPPRQDSPLALFVFTAVTVLLFLLLLLLLILLARNILKMYGDGRSRVLGSRCCCRLRR